MAFYNFTDTWRVSGDNQNYGSEAFTINGDYIEDYVDGYKTLYVKGRESMSADVELIDGGRNDGSVFNFRKYPERIITVGYQLKAESAEDFREAFNTLARRLNVEQAQFVFDDEPDKFFVGSPAEFGDVEAGRNNVTGEFNIVCADPFKYSVEEYTVELPQNTEKTVNYGGTVPAIPKITGITTGYSGGDIVSTASWFEMYRLNDSVLAFESGDDDAEKLAELTIPSSGTGSGWTEYKQETTFDDTYYQAMAQGHFVYNNDDATNVYRFIAKLNLNTNSASYSPSIEIYRNYEGTPQTELRFKVGDKVVYSQYIDDMGGVDFPFRLSFERGASTTATARGYLIMKVTYQFGDLIYTHKEAVNFTASDADNYQVAGAMIEYGKNYMSTSSVTFAGSMFVIDAAVYNMSQAFLYGVPHDVDVENARYYIDDLYTPYPNNPANDWSGFKLKRGINVALAKSMGIASGYFKAYLKYREVFI